MKLTILALFIILPLSLLYGQQNDLFADMSPPCAFESDSNAFENGLLSPSEGTQVVAIDILVAPGEVFTLSEIEANFFSVSVLTNADITYYQDDNGLPGSVLSTMIDVSPTTVFDIGSFGIFIWKAIFEVPNFDFAGQAGEETRYWISITFSNSDGNDDLYWETKSIGQQGLRPAVNDNGAGWELIDPGSTQHKECVYVFSGECNLLSVASNSLNNITVFPNPAREIISVSLPTAGALQIVNPLGTVLYEKNLDMGIHNISIPEFSSGLHFVQLITETGRSVSKVILE